MLNKKEITSILVAIIILGLITIQIGSVKTITYGFLSIFLIVAMNITAKKWMSYNLDAETEISLWNIKRYGFKPYQHFKNPFPAWLIAPLIIGALTIGYVKWMAVLVFDVKPKIYRAAKRHGLYSFSEMTEWHIGLIAAAGIVANLVVAFFAYFAGFEEFARLSIYFSFFNLIPLSDLDGNKVFFGSLVLWSTLAIIVLIATAAALLLV